MIVSVHKSRGLGAASYSVPGIAISISDGRYYIPFQNPNGTWSNWFSNMAVGSIPGDNNFVNPPDSVWQSVGVSGAQAQQNLANQLVAQQKMAATASAPLTYAQALANQSVQQEKVQAVLDANAAARAAAVQTSSGGSKVASFSFTSSGGNNSQLQVGDSWTVLIMGAAPGTSVTLTGTHNGASFGTVVAPGGRTDGAGNYTASATVGQSDIGTWQEVWSVGGVNVGGINFSVVASSGTTPPSQAPAGSVVPPSTGGTSTSVNTPTTVSAFDLFGDTSAPISIGSFQIGTYTAVGLAAAVVIGIMMFSGRRR